MFQKILVANRGEIALRIIRACKEMGIKTVIAYSTADRESLPVLLADEKICIGPEKANDSYNNMASILTAFQLTKADAIHPGYGFLAENPSFFNACKDVGATLIAPSLENIVAMGDKVNARETVSKLGIPVLPGSKKISDNKDAKEAFKIASSLGYPVMIKAAGGGGGKGIRIVKKKDDLQNALQTCREEANSSFDSSDLYMEKYIRKAKHIEIQLLCDNYGNIIYFPERDCSLQRRHQKILEESPSTILEKKQREELSEAAKKIAKEINYRNAGTIEFLFDLDSRKFYFIEMNTRIQVEHPVSEEVSAVDIIKEQILIAAGEKLQYKQDNIEVKNHALECRINAEDPEKLMPSSGKIIKYIQPSGLGIRVDTHLFQDYEMPPFYDSLIAKVITSSNSREETIKKMLSALDEYTIEGIKTNIKLHKEILSNQEFLLGDYDTTFLDKFMPHEKKIDRK